MSTDHPPQSDYEIELQGELERQFLRVLHDQAAAQAAARSVMEDDGDSWHNFLIDSIAGLELTPSAARDLWFQVRQHWLFLCEVLGRNPGIHIATLDWLRNEQHRVHAVRLQIFESDEEAFGEEKDSLTRLAREKQFKIRCEVEISRSRRHRSTLTVGRIQIDHFDLLQRTRGPRNTSEVIRIVGKIIQTAIRDTDYAFRHHGHSFSLILPETDRSGAYVVMERIRTGAEIELKSYQTTVSGGLSTFPDDGESVDELVSAAERQLQQAIEKGGNRISFHSDERRSFPRLDGALMIRIKTVGDKLSLSQEAITKDISGGGFSFEHGSSFQKGAPIQGEIELPDMLVQFLGQVVRCRELGASRYEVAITFTAIDPESRFRLLSFAH